MKRVKEATVQYQTETTTVNISTELLARLPEAAEWNGVPLQPPTLSASATDHDQTGGQRNQNTKSPSAV